MNYRHTKKSKGDAIRADDWNALGETLERISQNQGPRNETIAVIGGFQKVGIGTDHPQVELEVNGTTWTHELLARNIRAGKIYLNGRAIGEADGEHGQLSDARLKQNVRDLDDPLARLMQLHPVHYRWNDHPKVNHLPKTPRIGLIAGEVEHICPEVVSEDSDGFKHIDFGGLTAMLIAIVKQQQDLISGLVERVKQMENQSGTAHFA